MTTATPPTHYCPNGIDFQGWRLADVTSDDGTEEKAENHSRVALYRTTEGRFVALAMRMRKGVEHQETKVFATRQQAQNWLGFGSLSLRAYAEAEWPI